MKQIHTLEHTFLVAMPTLDNSWFEKTVIYMVEDNDQGSMGLVINLPNNINIQNLFEHFSFNIPHEAHFLEDQVLLGGPVDLERGFILHTGSANWKSTLPLADQLNMTVSEDLLEAMSANVSPENFVVCLGFAGWEPGQLAQEIQDNNWLNIPYSESLLFTTPIEERWQEALSTLGIAPEFLSVEAGHA